MTLLEIVSALDELDDEATILARKPWTPASVATVVNDAPDDVAEMTRDGMVYFLEVSLVRELRSDWDAADGGDGFCERLIRYAINDA
jgi:hypothetical protein